MITPGVKTVVNYPILGEVLAHLEARQIPVSVWEQTPRSQQLGLMPDAGRFQYLFVCPETIALPDTPSDPFSVLESELEMTSSWESFDSVSKKISGDCPPFLGGLLCLMAHEASGYLERIKGLEQHPRLPLLVVQKVSLLIVWDKKLAQTHLIYWPTNSGQDSKHNSKELFEELSQLCAQDLAATTNDKNVTGKKCGLATNKPSKISMRHLRQDFVSMVQRAKEYIAAGDVFQVVIANCFYSNKRLAAGKFYRELTKNNPSPYQFLVNAGKFSVVGSSPEMMLYLEPPGDLSSRQPPKISMRLVAGTYPRENVSDVPDMRADPKEHAEHVMLVDHIRNDIGRVAKIGSVCVEDLCAIETYKDVHHLVSQVSGRLKKGVNCIDALRATFPIATLTGTPKIRALEILTELEQQPRGFFGGAVILLGYNGFLESGVVIRSAVLHQDEENYCDNQNYQTEIYAGAGIVYDSIPEREFDECIWKASALLELVEVQGEQL